MTDLIDAALGWPTVIFTIPLGVSLIYWLFVVLGALDIDLFHAGDAAGAAKGVGEALAGGKGAGDALAGGKGVAGDGHHHAAGHDGGFWHALGLASVPVTISFTMVVLLGWISSLLLMQYLGGAVGDGAGWLPAVVFFVALMIGAGLGGQLVRPLGPVFKVREGKSNRDYVGSVCTVTTGHVDDHFGQATLEDGGTVLVIPVRCDRAGALARGQRALVIDYDPARNAYVVEPTEGLGSLTDGAPGA